MLLIQQAHGSGRAGPIHFVSAFLCLHHLLGLADIKEVDRTGSWHAIELLLGLFSQSNI